METSSSLKFVGSPKTPLSRWLRDQMYRLVLIFTLAATYFPMAASAQQCTTGNIVLINSSYDATLSEFYFYDERSGESKGQNILGSSGLRPSESVTADITPGIIYNFELVWTSSRGVRRLRRNSLEFCRINTIYFNGSYIDPPFSDRNLDADFYTQRSVSRRCAEPRRTMNVGNLTSHKIEEFYISPSSGRTNTDNRRNSISINAKSDARIMLPSAPYFDITIVFRIDNALHRFERRNVPICNVPSTVMFIGEFEGQQRNSNQERFSIEFQSPQG